MAEIVAVRGTATERAVPDEVGLSIAITALERSPDEALAVVAERSQEVERVLTGAGVAEANRSTSGVVVREEREWDRERYVHRGYRASNQLWLRLDDPEPVGRILRDVVSVAEATVNGPWWTVAPDNPARAEACRQAALDARRRAQAYAGALDERLGTVLSIEEPATKVRQGDGGFLPARAVMASAPGPEAAQAPDLAVHPGELEVSAEVDVTYALEAG